MLRQFLYIGLLLSGLLLASSFAETAAACPMCRDAAETSDALPRAYMYSILFMLSVPATLLAGFGIGFYRLSQSGQAEDAETYSDDSDSDVFAGS